MDHISAYIKGYAKLLVNSKIVSNYYLKITKSHNPKTIEDLSLQTIATHIIMESISATITMEDKLKQFQSPIAPAKNKDSSSKRIFPLP